MVGILTVNIEKNLPKCSLKRFFNLRQKLLLFLAKLKCATFQLEVGARSKRMKFVVKKRNQTEERKLQCGGY